MKIWIEVEIDIVEEKYCGKCQYLTGSFCNISRKILQFENGLLVRSNQCRKGKIRKEKIDEREKKESN